MAGQSNAKAERLSIGELDLDTAWHTLAGEMARDDERAASEFGSAAPGAGASSQEPALETVFGEGQSEAEAQLYAYLSRAREPRKSGFPPLDVLSARLREFAPPPAREPTQDEAVSADQASLGQLEWFEGKFGELRQLITHHAAGKHEIVSINTRLAEIIDRVDRLAAALPDEKAFASVEKQLSDLSKTLAQTRDQAATDADRISRAAKEILAAAGSMEQSRIGFEAAAKDTVQELRQTVVATAPLTIGQITTVWEGKKPESGLARLEREFQALNAQSRENSDRATAALDRVHNTLREFLERSEPLSSAPSQATAATKKRAAVHVPIAANAPEYTRSPSEFGGAPAKKPALDTITLRMPTPRPYARKAQEEAQTKPSRPSAYEHIPAAATSPREADPPRQAPQMSNMFREDERMSPLVGIVAVAIILLLASAALYYLHVHAYVRPMDVSILAPQSSESPRIRATLRTGASLANKAEERTPPQAATPALLSATDPGRSANIPQTPDEDVQMLANAASRGDREAQFRIGARFLNNTTRSDASAAARWLSRAADQGHVESQFMLASLYEKGAGVPKDERRALELYRKAAQAGHARAMYNLAVLLSTHDTAQDYSEAAAWFTRAATAGLADSQYNLAVLYERGLGVPQDERKAYFWYVVAARGGDKDATLQAERLKRGLLASEAEAISEEAGSWIPTAEETSGSQPGADTHG
jgi:localization factor PodJL